MDFSSIVYEKMSEKAGPILAFQTMLKTLGMEKSFYNATLNNDVPLILDQIAKDAGWKTAIEIGIDSLHSITRVIDYAMQGISKQTYEGIEIPKDMVLERAEKLMQAFCDLGYEKQFLRRIRTKRHLGSMKDAIKVAINILGKDNGAILAGEVFQTEKGFIGEFLGALAEIKKTRDEFIKIVKENAEARKDIIGQLAKDPKTREEMRKAILDKS